jgi:regulatory protein
MPGNRRSDPPEFHDGVITSLVARRGQADRVGVHIDGHLAFDLSAVVVDRAGLRAGDRISAGRQRELHLEDAPYRARERALRFLGARDRSEKEVEMRLRHAGFDAAVIGVTLGWLRDLGYVDDRRFAAAYSAEKRRTGLGPRRIRAELAGKGIERPIVDEVLELADGGSDAVEAGSDALEQLVRRRFASQFGIDPDAAERRLAGFLARRGYDWDTIGDMARKLRAESAAGPSSPSIP